MRVAEAGDPVVFWLTRRLRLAHAQRLGDRQLLQIFNVQYRRVDWALDV